MIEEIKAIEYFNNFIKYTKKIAEDEKKMYGETFYQKTLVNRARYFEGVLNMIKEKDNEIEKKDKIIDLMADFISKYHCFSVNVFDIDNECKKEHECKDCIKQYFENKVKE